MKSFLSILIFSTVAAIGFSQNYERSLAAVAVINVGNVGATAGSVELRQAGPNAPVVITGEISGLEPNSVHGFHVHGSGDIRKGCGSTGGHFNPKGMTHGAPQDKIRHVGDLGNVVADANGVARVSITDDVISLCGPNSIIGRAFVVHSGVDDLGKGGAPDSLTTGNAGSRIGCGIIGIL